MFVKSGASLANLEPPARSFLSTLLFSQNREHLKSSQTRLSSHRERPDPVWECGAEAFLFPAFDDIFPAKTPIRMT